MRTTKDISKDADLVKSYREHGDLTTLGLLYEPYMPLVYGVCLKYLKDRAQAQDGVMAIFEELIVKLPKFEIANFKSWLYVLTKNYCLMLLRKQKSGGSVPLEESHLNFMENEVNVHHEGEGAVDEEQIELLNSCLEKLKVEQKQCVALFYLDSKSYQEIEALTSFELKKVKSYIQNGKRNLKLCMEKRD